MKSTKLAKIEVYAGEPRPATDPKIECGQCAYDAPPDHKPGDRCPKCLGIRVWVSIAGQTPIAIPARVPW